MTVFDVLRYPISDLPTREEIEALPEEVFIVLRESSNESRIKSASKLLQSRHGVATVLRIMARQPMNKTKAQTAIAIARQALKDLP